MLMSSRINSNDILEIRTQFSKLQSKEDLVDLINHARKISYGREIKIKPVQVRDLNYYAFSNNCKTRYNQFEIRKKTGGVRVINAPVVGLKVIQRALAFILQCVFEPHKAAMGFVRDRSIVDNANVHVGQRYIYNLDLKDFFPSIDQARVWSCLRLAPFNLKGNEDSSIEIVSWETFKRSHFNVDERVEFVKTAKGFKSYTKVGEITCSKTININAPLFVLIKNSRNSDEQKDPSKVYRLVNSSSKVGRETLGNLIASLCCTELDVERFDEQCVWQVVQRRVLPQGAPTSPVLSNIVCQRLDFLLTGVAKRFGLRYTRYADDITFSSMHNVYQPESEFLKELHRIIAEQNFHIKESKTRLQKDGYRKEVTGLLVNEKANVQQRYIKQLRMWLYYWERYGYERASGFFLQQYIADKGHVKNGKPDMVNVISGKLDYLKMVKGADNALYLKLKSRFDLLTGINKLIKVKSASILPVDTFSIVDFEISSTNSEDVDQKNANRLKISINPISSVKDKIKLKRKIIIDKGESLPLEEYVENNEKEEKEIDLSKHKPIDVTRFLLNFRSSEGLKFLTHDYDKPESVFNYEYIIAISKKEFEELSTEFIIPVNLRSRIYQFAFGDPSKAWWFNRLPYKLNWQSHELLSWMVNNPNTHPIKNVNFEQGFIKPFKKSIEIKTPDLEYIFKNKLAENLASKYTSFDIKLIDLDKANFYTNVDAFQVGISYIFKSINQRFKNSNKIRIEFLREADYEGRKRIIKIIHLDSKCDKPLDKKELFQGDLLEAEKAFFGICDWSIISKSPDDTVNKLNVLFDINSNKMPKEKIDESLIEGFTHILTFYA